MPHLSEDGIEVRRLTKGKLPGLPFVAMRDAVLGKGYELSIAFVGTEQAREINRQNRGKDKPTNILSFPLGKKSGELVISLAQTRKDAKQHGMAYRDFLGFLVIHGMLHLKGYDHGSTMEAKEKLFSRRFGYDTAPIHSQ